MNSKSESDDQLSLADFVPDVEADEETRHQGKRKAHDVDEAKRAVLRKIPPGDEEEVLDHNQVGLVNYWRRSDWFQGILKFLSI